MNNNQYSDPMLTKIQILKEGKCHRIKNLIN